MFSWSNVDSSLLGLLNVFRNLESDTVFVGTTIVERELDGVTFLTSTPFFAGTSIPGTQIAIVIKDLVGNIAGHAEIFADLAGNWATPIHNANLTDQHHTVEITEEKGSYGNGDAGIGAKTVVVQNGEALQAVPRGNNSARSGQITGSIVNPVSLDDAIGGIGRRQNL